MPEENITSPEKKISEVGAGQIEQAPATEQVAEKEKLPEQAPEKVAVQAGQVAAAPVQPSVPAPAVPPAPEKSQELIEIESILSEGLAPLYKELPENRKAEFKQKGEEAAQKIQGLLRAAKVKMHKIINVIINWLKMIPGVNKFFLEQESKIKTDKLLEYKKERGL